MAKGKPSKNGKGKPDKQVNSRFPYVPTQWKPGQSGNPNGRPNGPTWLSKHREVWEQKAQDRILRQLANIQFGDDRENAEGWFQEVRGKMTMLEAIAIRNAFKALTPDGDAIVKIMWEMNDGKPTMKIAGADGGPIQLEPVVNLKNLSTEELRQWRELQLKASGKDE